MSSYHHGATQVQLLLDALNTLSLTFSCMYFILMVLELIPVALEGFIAYWDSDSEDEDEDELCDPAC
jgi:hypothetical protein